MTQINVEEIKKNNPKPKIYFVLQSVGIIFVLIVSLFLTIFFTAVLYRNFINFFIFPKIFGLGFWLTVFISLAIIFSLIIFLINLYRTKDWKLSHNWLVIFLITVLITIFGSSLFLTVENRLEKQENLPTYRAQSVFERVIPPFESNIKIFRGRVEKFDPRGRSMKVTNFKESLDLFLPLDVVLDLSVSEGQMVTILYKVEDKENVLVGLRTITKTNKQNLNQQEQYLETKILE